VRAPRLNPSVKKQQSQGEGAQDRVLVGSITWIDDVEDVGH
jgi:hypothetical protein